MAHQNWTPPYSDPVAADLSAYEWGFVSFNGSAALALTAAGARPDGILDNAKDCTAAGKMGRWWPHLGGIRLKAKAGGDITKGAKISVGANGRAVVSVTQNHIYVGIALEAAVNNQVFDILYNPDAYGKVP